MLYSFHRISLFVIFLVKSLCLSQRRLVLQRILIFFLIIFILLLLILDKIGVNISSYSFNDTDLSLGTHLHIGLKLCILTGNSEILIKSDLLTSIKILRVSHKSFTSG